MYAVSILFGFFASGVGMLLFFATHKKAISYPLVVGGLMLSFIGMFLAS